MAPGQSAARKRPRRISPHRGTLMTSFDHRFEHRRRLLQWLSASPLFASPGFALAASDRPSKLPELEAAAAMIANPEEGINEFEFEPVFLKNVPPPHVAY